MPSGRPLLSVARDGEASFAASKDEVSRVTARDIRECWASRLEAAVGCGGHGGGLWGRLSVKCGAGALRKL